MATDPARVTIRDVAREAGVSVATASRVVRGETSVRPFKVEAVMDAVARLGYVPNSAARGLKERRTGAIAMLFPESEARVFTDPFFGAVVSGAAAIMNGAGFQLVLVMNDATGGTDKIRRFIHGNHCDGILLASHHETPALIAALRHAPMPLVSLGPPLGDLGFPCVDLENYGGGRLAAQHLLSRGYRKFGIITGPQDMASARERVEGFTAELAAAGLSPVRLFEGDYSSDSGAAAMRDAIPELHRYDAIFAINDLMAFAALQEAANAGLRVPHDIAVMGFDNVDASRGQIAGLTTIANPVHDMAAAATRLLLDLIDTGGAGVGVGSEHIFTPHLVVRSST